MPQLRCLTIVSTAVAAGLLMVGLSTAEAIASTGPRMARASGADSPAVGGINDYFNGDSCTSSTFCMAVGAYNLNRQFPGLSEKLSGGSWIAESVPRPSHGSNIFSNEVSCASPVNCLLVGDHYAGPRGLSANLAQAWNGSSWRIVTVTGPAGTAFSALDDVACPTAKFCLVIGTAGSSNRFRNTAYTWTNSTTWRQITVPQPRGERNSELGGLACFNAFNCMAVGNYTSASGRNLPFAARWHDGRWKLLAAPAVLRQRSTTFQGISCPSATLCMAVGDTVDNTRGRFFHAFAEVWTGGRWKVSTLRRRPSVFGGASCPARNRCFAVGYTFPTSTTFAHPLIEIWNGRTWTTQKPAQTFAPHRGDVLSHVSCASRLHCEAVGYRFDPGVSNTTQTLAELWNGHRWTVQTTVNP